MESAVTLRRTFDPAFLNQVVNHADVRPWLGGAGELDVSEVVSDPRNFALVNEYGGWIVAQVDAGLYDVHSQFLPEGRTPALIEDMRAAIFFMFTQTDCVELVTRCPDNNKAALGLARAAGFRETFRREEIWPVEGDKPCGVSFQSLTIDRWRGMDDRVLAAGSWFHHRLEEEKQKSGSALMVHADDETHDRAVGAAVSMIRAGNPLKAVFSYNRWAKFAGYAPIQMIGAHPPTFDVVDAIVALKGDDMEVLLCR